MANRNLPTQHQTTSGSGQLMPLLGGGAALLWGLRRGGLTGMLTSAAGAGLLYYGIRGGESSTAGKSVNITASVNINRSPEELYNFWRGFTRLPQFMKYLKEVSTTGPNRTHWVAHSPVGPSVEWDSEVTADQPNERIAWRSVEGSQLPNEGEVRFIPSASSPGEGTLMEVAMRFQPPGGSIGSQIGQLLSGLTEQEINADLQRFKRLMESGKASAKDKEKGKEAQ